jgi:hypothetical protein
MVGYTMEKSNAVCNLCEMMIAENGTVLLNSKQASMRRLPVFPKTQMFFANAEQVCYSLSQAMKVYNKKHSNELPSLLNLADNKAGNFYHEGQLVMKADGTEDVYLILIDEKIPASNRV